MDLYFGMLTVRVREILFETCTVLLIEGVIVIAGGFMSIGGDIASWYRYGFAVAKLTKLVAVIAKNKNAMMSANAKTFLFIGWNHPYLDIGVFG